MQQVCTAGLAKASFPILERGFLFFSAAGICKEPFRDTVRNIGHDLADAFGNVATRRVFVKMSDDGASGNETRA